MVSQRGSLMCTCERDRQVIKCMVFGERKRDCKVNSVYVRERERESES